jgi:predicted regulator of Ras-like GTPase activity (Roadblock/LC7/MglB family)
MQFREVLGEIVRTTPGGIGAVLVDDEGETIDIYTTGDSFEMKLVGAHHGIVLSTIRKVLGDFGNGESLGGISIRSEKYIFNIAPVQEDVCVILLQDSEGVPSVGMKILREALPSLSRLI